MHLSKNLMEHKEVVQFLETKKWFVWDKPEKIIRHISEGALGAMRPPVARNPIVNEVADLLGNALRR